MSNYQMRSLKTSDIFKMSKILKKMDLKIKIDKEANQAQVGAQLIQNILENIHSAEEEVNDFLSGLVGITPEQFSDLEIEDTLEIFSLFKEQKGVANFLKLAGK